MLYFRIIFFLSLVAVISLGIHWLVENDGTAEFIWLGYQVETSIAFIIFSVTFSFILLMMIFQLILMLVSLPKRMGRRYEVYLLEQSLKNIQIGYAALLSGDYDQAKKYSRRLIDARPKNKRLNRSIGNLTDMLAAKVAQEEGELIVAQDYFNKFMENKKQRFFAVKAMLDSSFQQGRIDDAIRYAEEAYALKPDVKDGARSVLELYKKSENFIKAEEFLYKYRRRHRFFKDKYNDIDVDAELCIIWYNLARELYESDEAVHRKDKAGYLAAAKYLDKAIRLDPYNKDILALSLKTFKQLKLEGKARKLVEKVWYKNQSVEIGQLYLDVYSSTSYKDATKKKLKAIEGLRSISPDSEIIDRLKDKIYDFQIEY